MEVLGSWLEISVLLMESIHPYETSSLVAMSGTTCAWPSGVHGLEAMDRCLRMGAGRDCRALAGCYRREGMKRRSLHRSPQKRMLHVNFLVASIKKVIDFFFPGYW